MKFDRSDKKYFRSRKRFSKKIGKQELWSVMDQWPLYCGIGNLARSMAIADVFRRTLSVPGHVAEFGCWQGANIVFLAKLLKIYEPNGNRVVYGFDSFKGLSAFSSADGPGVKLAGKYHGAINNLKSVLNLYDLNDDVILVRGLIERTLRTFLDRHPALSFSFVYCDTDLYQSTKLILELMHPRLVKGGVFVLDEWNYENVPGEGIAANNFLRRYGNSYAVEHATETRQPSLVLRRTKS